MNGGRIRPGDIDDLRERTDIVEIISEHVQLKKAGRLFKGLCPFHDEKTPSFVVDPVKQVYHCFGCREGGNVYNFLMKKEGLEFREAVEKLAQREGYQLHYEGVDRDYRKREGRKEKLYRLHQLACDLYRKMLHSSGGSRAREYLAGRGLKEETWKLFSVGYAPGKWDFLYRRAVQNGFTPQEIMESGLFVRSEKGVYDRFRDRIIFPIEDQQDRIVGFGGRIIDQGEPKYINSPETLIYVKSKHLYNLNRARREIMREGYAIVVEGYTDVIFLHQAGIKNVVATLGTALGEEHFRLLSRITEKVILAFDADTAGMGASERGMAYHQDFNLDIRVMVMPSGFDPADFVVEEGRDKFLQAAGKSVPLVEFCLEKRLSSYDPRDLPSRQRGVVRALEFLAGLQGEMNMDRLVAQVADWADIDYLVVMDNLKRLQKSRSRQVMGRGRESDVGVGALEGYIRTEREILRTLLNFPIYIDEYYGWIDVELFQDPLCKNLVTSIVGMYEEGEIPQAKKEGGALESGERDGFIHKLLERLEGEREKRLAISLLFDAENRYEGMDEQVLRRGLEDLFSKLKGFCLERQIRTLKKELEELVSRSARDHEQEARLAREIHELETLRMSFREGPES